MAFNKLSLLTVEDTPVTVFNIPYVHSGTSVLVNGQDIFYHLGTNLNQNTWVNPSGGSFLTVTDNLATAPATLANLTDEATTSVSDTTLPWEVTFQFLTGFEVDIRSFRYRWTGSNSFGPKTIKWEGSNDGSTWTQIYRYTNINSTNTTDDTWYLEPLYDNRFGFFSYLRFTVEDSIGGVTFNLQNLEIYGLIRNLTTGVAGFKTPGDFFDSLLDIDAANPREYRNITYDSTNQIWEATINQPWKVNSQVMTGNLVLTTEDLHNPIYFVLNPNGANREIEIPTSPNPDDTFKVRNLDGNFDITIKEGPSDPSPVVLNNAGKLQYEYVYDGTEYHVLG